MQVSSILLFLVDFANEIILGFDPIFFLHHCNVDRLYAFWEYVYPEYWIADGWKSETGEIIPFSMCIFHSVSLYHLTLSSETAQGSFYQDNDAPVDHATPLGPFRAKDVNNYWTSDDTRTLLDSNPVKKCTWFFHELDPVMNFRLNRLHLPCYQRP